MIYDKVLNLLKVLFLEPKPNKQFNGNMGKILLKLKEKAAILEKELLTEKNDKKRKEIKQMLKVIYKQYNKGQKLIQKRKREEQSVLSIKPKVISKPKFSPLIKI